MVVAIPARYRAPNDGGTLNGRPTYRQPGAPRSAAHLGGQGGGVVGVAAGQAEVLSGGPGVVEVGDAVQVEGAASTEQAGVVGGQPVLVGTGAGQTPAGLVKALPAAVAVHVGFPRAGGPCWCLGRLRRRCRDEARGRALPATAPDCGEVAEVFGNVINPGCGPTTARHPAWVPAEHRSPRGPDVVTAADAVQVEDEGTSGGLSKGPPTSTAPRTRRPAAPWLSATLQRPVGDPSATPERPISPVGHATPPAPPTEGAFRR